MDQMLDDLCIFASHVSHFCSKNGTANTSVISLFVLDIHSAHKPYRAQCCIDDTSALKHLDLYSAINIPGIIDGFALG